MESLQYKVIFSGNIAGEQQLESVKQHLMTKFNLSPQRVEALFSGKPVVIKENVDYQDALKYQTAFKRAGLICRVEPVQSPETAPVPPSAIDSPISSQQPANTFTVLFSGEIAPERSLAEVKQSLQTVLKADAQKIDRLFIGHTVTVKRQVDLQTAERLQSAFQQAGAICRIEPDMSAPSARVPQSTPPPLQPSAHAGLSLEKRPLSPSPATAQLHSFSCPKCGHQFAATQGSHGAEQDGRGVCPACGIIMEKYTKRAGEVGSGAVVAAANTSTSPRGQETGITVETTFFFISVDLFFCTPRIIIDGQMYMGKWWKQLQFPLAAGRHTVRIYFKHLFRPECGANAVTFTIKEGESYAISYFMWPWMFMKGKISAKKKNGSQKAQTLRYASFWKRLLAGCIDLMIAIIAIVGALFLFAKPIVEYAESDAVVTLVVVGTYLAFWPYFSCFESSIWQASPGKKLLKLKIVHIDGSKVTFLQSTLRFFSNVFLSMMLSCYAGIVMAAFTQKKQGLHDMIAKTMVVTEE